MRSLIRAILIVVLLVLVGAAVFAWWQRTSAANAQRAPGETTLENARERGAELGEKAAVAASKIQETAAEAALTGKIKAKMALDDHVKSRAIDVSTNDSTVTLRGTVRSLDERDRALQLARDTAGVTRVIDRLAIEQ